MFQSTDAISTRHSSSLSVRVAQQYVATDHTSDCHGPGKPTIARCVFCRIQQNDSSNKYA